ncbi:MAG: HAD family hydrolase [Candidatus Korarchaeum sp.]|nr:HAD family hydrolase [Candidatus Korarchaeum sp.]MDW8034974.1 HAD family hydrolase [Candidatus Korarchaeum sp.]
MIRAISFDLWFTLIWETKEDEELYLRMRLESLRSFLKEEGHEISLEVLKEAYSATKDFRMVVHPRELLRMLLAYIGFKLSDEALERVLLAYTSSTDGFVPKINEEALEVLPQLKSMGLRLALVTNTSFGERSVRAILRNVGLDLFDIIVTSCEAGFMKPQRAIFSILLDKLGLDGSQVVHVGDSCYHDVIGATNAGLRALHYPKLAHLARHGRETCEGSFEKLENLNQLMGILGRWDR